MQRDGTEFPSDITPPALCLSQIKSAAIRLQDSVCYRKKTAGVLVFGYSQKNTTLKSAIIITSLISRVLRSTELRVEQIEIDETARRFIIEESQHTIRLIANRRNAGDEAEYLAKEKEVREDNHIPASDPILFLEVEIVDASEFVETVRVRGVQVGNYRILRAQGAAVPNTIAAILLQIRDLTKQIPHAYFGWVEGNPIQYLLRFLLFGEGDTAVVTREVLRRAESNPEWRPGIHVGG